MNNRWGQTLEAKGPSRNSSSNNINININFNNVKDKTNVFAGKKVNNFVEVSNDPKSNIGRPNVSMETLKQKKKIISVKEETNLQMRRKKSKSKIINELCTPEKRRNRNIEDQKSGTKTNKRTSKSRQNLKNYYLKERIKKSRSKSNSNSKYQSKSRSKSQSSQKLIKNPSKNKVSIPIKYQNKKVKPKHEQKPSSKKGKMPKKIQSNTIDLKQSVNEQKNPKSTKRSDSKYIKGKKKRNKSPQKEDRLKRPPLVYEIDDHDFNEQTSYKNHQEEVYKVLYEDKIQEKQKKSIVEKYLSGNYSNNDLRKLTKIAILIQKCWRGFKVRRQFFNELNLMEKKILIAQRKIDESDPRYWGEDDSIVKIEDQEEKQSESNKPSRKSSNQIQPSIEEGSQNLFSKRVIEREPDPEIEEKLNKLQTDLQKQRNQYLMLEEENRTLKTQLQKVSAQQSFNSFDQSAEDEKNEEGISDMIVVKLPNRIKKEKIEEKKESPKPKKPALEIVTDLNDDEDHISKIKSFGGEFRSPKVVFENNYADIFKKKESKLKESYMKKSERVEKLLHDRLVSPRTYNYKKSQLEERFKRQTELIKTRLDEASRVMLYFRQMKEEEVKDQPPEIPNNQPLNVSKKDQVIEPSKFQLKKREQFENHVIEEYPNVDIRSHREKNEQDDEIDVDDEKKEENIFGMNQRAQNIFRKLQEEAEKKEDVPQYVEQDIEDAQQIERVTGMQTTLHFIKEYCIGLIEYIRNSVQHREEFFQSITSPIRYDHGQFLKTYRTTMENQNDTSYNSVKKDYMYPFFKIIYPKSNIISKESFEQFNSNYDKLQGQCNYKIQKQFFLNSIYDTLNEALDYERPSSVYGQPPLWVTQSRSLKNHSISSLDPFISMDSPRLDEACGVAIARLIQWATSLCGFIPQSPQMQNIVIDEQQIQTIRQTRMALMLERGLVEDEQKMIDMGIEQTEIRLQLAEVMMEECVEELIRQMRWI